MAPNLVISALEHAWATLETLGLPMAVLGGIALAGWKHPRATDDVDISVSLGQRSVDELIQTMERAGLRPKRQPPVLSVGKLRIVQLLYEPPQSYVTLQIDLLLADCDYQKQALARRVPLTLPHSNFEVFILSCEDMIIHKLMAGRIIDRADVAALLRANRDTLDFSYVNDWVGRLGLAADFSEISMQAFPDDQASKPAP